MENNKIAGLEVERLKEVALERFGKDDYEHLQKVAVMVASAHCAKVSYDNHGSGVDYKKDIALYDRLLKEGHMSPFEHCARAMDEEEFESHIKGVGDLSNPDLCTYTFSEEEQGWSGNFRGFVQLRKEIE